MEEPQRYPAGDLFQTASTTAGIAIALATFTHDRLLAVVFMLAGLVSLAGSAYALSVLWDEAGLGWADLLPRRRVETLTPRYEALLYTAWGLILPGIAYVILLLRRLP